MSLFAKKIRTKYWNDKRFVFTIAAAILVAAMLLGACSLDTNNPAPTSDTAITPADTTEPGGLVPTVEKVPDPNETVNAYLNAWKNFDYTTMYDMLTLLSRASKSS